MTTGSGCAGGQEPPAVPFSVADRQPRPPDCALRLALGFDRYGDFNRAKTTQWTTAMLKKLMCAKALRQINDSYQETKMPGFRSKRSRPRPPTEI